MKACSDAHHWARMLQQHGHTVKQATLYPHRTRQGFVEERTAAYNRLRGLPSEFGVVLPQSPDKLRRHITEHLDTLPGWAKHSISDLLQHAGNIEDRLVKYDRA